MPFPRPLAALVLAAPLLLGAQTLTVQPAQTTPVTESRTLPLASGGRLHVGNVNGAIKVTPWDREQVSFTGRFTPGSQHQQVKVVLEAKAGRLDIRAEYPKNDHGQGPAVDMDLQVPRRLLAELANVNGAIAVDGIEGQVECRNVNGEIRLGPIKGGVTLKTVNGGIEAKGLTGPVTAKSVNGSIKLGSSALKGRLNLSTVNGSLSCKAPGATELKTSSHRITAVFPGSDQELTVSTVNGDVTLD